jgi:hypothetical protein
MLLYRLTFPTAIFLLLSIFIAPLGADAHLLLLLLPLLLPLLLFLLLLFLLLFPSLSLSTLLYGHQGTNEH